MNSYETTTRYLVYKASASRHFLCTVSARNRKHALEIAKRTFTLTKTAYARPEITSESPGAVK
jgi:hypothetical protein